MNKLDYHTFYDYIWYDDNISVVISDRFLDEEEDFVRNFSLELYRQYELRDDLSIQTLKKFVEVAFSNMAIFKPNTSIIRPIRDDNDVF